MSKNVTSVSDQLQLLQGIIGDKVISDGHVHMDPIQSKVFLHRISKALEAARFLENAYSQAEWNRRAYLEKLTDSLGKLKVLRLFKKDAAATATNVIPFPSRTSTPPVPTGGDAA